MSGTISVAKTATQGADTKNNNKKVLFKNWVPFIDCISVTKNTKVYNAKDIAVVLPMYNLI